MPDYNGVHLTTNGRYWQAYWYDDQGKKLTAGCGRRDEVSKREAQQKCLDLAIQHRVRPSTKNRAAAHTLASWWHRYAELRHDIAPATLREHQTTMDRLWTHFGQERPIDRITREDAAGWRRWLATHTFKRRGGTDDEGNRLDVTYQIDEQTIRKHIRNAKTIFGWAHRLDLIGVNPFDREPAQPLDVDKDWHYLTFDQLDQVLKNCPDDIWRCLFALARLAGLRRGEILRLRFDAINWQAHTLTVEHQGARTTKKRRRVVPLAPKLYALLLSRQNAAPAGETHVVPLAATSLRVDRQMPAIIAAAGLDPWDKPLHTLRKNCETDWLRTYPVMDVCSWLGHAPAVAAKHYHQARADVMAGVTGQAPTESPSPQPQQS